MRGKAKRRRRRWRRVSFSWRRYRDRPIYAQRSAPFGRWTGVYHIWLWKLVIQVVIGPKRYLPPA